MRCSFSERHNAIPGILKSSTVRHMWSPQQFLSKKQVLLNKQYEGYGLGWEIIAPDNSNNNLGFCGGRLFAAYHTGGAIGGSSILMVVPDLCPNWKLEQSPEHNNPLPCVITQDMPASGKIYRRYNIQEDSNEGCKKCEDELLAKRVSNAKVSCECQRGRDMTIDLHSRCLKSFDGECERCSDNSGINTKRESSIDDKTYSVNEHGPKGVVISIVTNVTGVSFRKEAIRVAEMFSVFNS